MHSYLYEVELCTMHVHWIDCTWLSDAYARAGFTHVGVSYAERARVLYLAPTTTTSIETQFATTLIATLFVMTMAMTTPIVMRYARRGNGREIEIAKGIGMPMSIGNT